MKENYLINYSELFAEKLHVWLKKNKTFLGIVIGYLGTTIVQILDMMYEGKNMSDIVQKYFSLKPSTFIIILSLLIVLMYFVLEKFLDLFLSNKSLDSRFLELIEPFKSDLFSNQQISGYGWGENQTFVAAPRIQEGLKTDEIEFEVSNSHYNWHEIKRLDEELKDRDFNKEYEEYMKNEFYKYFTYDSERLMLTRKPTIYTDDHRIKIELKKIRWSELQFYWNHVLTNDNQKKKYVDNYFSNIEILSPNSFCLHLLVLTEDNKILLVKNSSNKLTDYPNHWTASLGEQIDKDDVENLQEDCAYKWVLRALKEELALTENDIDKRNIRYLSINLEGNVCNFSFMCMAVINKTSKELDTYLRTELRPDNEFDDFKFLDLEDVPKELVTPSLTYHPSSQLRMLYGYINKKGKSSIKKKILDVKYS